MCGTGPASRAAADLPGTGASARLRMLHWNIHSWRDESGEPNHEQVAALIAETAPDVVSLVEVNEPWGAPSLLGELAGRLGYYWVFVPALAFGADGPRRRPGGEVPSRGYGNALLTRRRLEAVQQWEIHTPDRLYDGTEPAEPRTAVCARIGAGAGSLWVCGTHLPASDPEARAGALRRFAALVAGLDGPWLACGDFNAPPSAWPGGRWPGAVRPDPPQPTYPAAAPSMAIDYCLVAAGLTADARVLPARGSDHLPVLVTAVTG